MNKKSKKLVVEKNLKKTDRKEIFETETIVFRIKYISIIFVQFLKITQKFYLFEDLLIY